MADKDNLLVEGYRFGSYQDAGLAEEESRKAAYFREKTVGRNARNLLAVYDRMLDEKVFQTPVGWEYLKEMQEMLRASGVPGDMVRPIPLYMTFSHMTGEELDKSEVRQRIRPARQKKKVDRFQISMVINIFLAIMVIAMFAITMNSDNPNILNYKQNITNQYATWDQELTQREKAVREKEMELQIEAEISGQ